MEYLISLIDFSTLSKNNQNKVLSEIQSLTFLEHLSFINCDTLSKDFLNKLNYFTKLKTLTIEGLFTVI